MAIFSHQSLLASTSCPAFATDATGRVLGFNGAAERMLGYKNASICGRRCWDLLAGRDPFGNRFCAQHCALREMVARGEPVHPFDLRLRTASGAMLEVSVSVIAVPASDSGRDAMLHLLRPVQRLTEVTGRSGDVQPAACGLNASANSRVDQTHTRSEGLTPRECETLARLAAGKSCHEIALAMGINLVTVRNHLKRIFPKLRVHSQAEAVSFAFRNRLV